MPNFADENGNCHYCSKLPDAELCTVHQKIGAIGNKVYLVKIKLLSDALDSALAVGYTENGWQELARIALKKKLKEYDP